MTLDIFREKGTPLAEQVFDWRDLVRPPLSKLDDEAFTRVRALFTSGIESESVRFAHACARMNGPLQPILAEMRRIEHHQQTMLRLLQPADQDALETALAHEQVAIELTANVARNEPDPYLVEVYEFGLLEDLDHLYRFSALSDRLHGLDPNVLLQSYTDIVPGRPTSVAHRHPLDDLRRPYDRTCAVPLTKIHAIAITAVKHQMLDYYLAVGPAFSDPIARQLHGEIASIEEQHVTQYESIVDPAETWLEKWLLHEVTEVWAYWSCVATEPSPAIRKIYERFLSYELGHLHAVMDLLRQIEGRDPHQFLPATLPTPIAFESQRDYVRAVLARGADLRADGPSFVRAEGEPRRSIERRDALNASGSPSEMVAAGYQYTTGGELTVLPPAGVADLAPTVALERVLEEPARPRRSEIRSLEPTHTRRGAQSKHAPHARPNRKKPSAARRARGGGR